MTQPAEEETCPYVAMEEGNIQEQAAAAPNKNDDDPDISIMTPNENSGTQTVGAVLASNDNSSGRKASSGLLPIAVQREDDWGLKAEEPTEIIKSKKAPDASTNPTVAPMVLDVPPRRALSAGSHNHLTLACCSSACSAFFTSIGALLGNLLLLYPAIVTIIRAIFWYQFAAARGKQGAECDLNFLGAFFWVSTVVLFLSVVGVMLKPRFSRRLQVSESRTITCSRIRVCLYYCGTLPRIPSCRLDSRRCHMPRDGSRTFSGGYSISKDGSCAGCGGLGFDRVDSLLVLF
jgi:hypothetical protein